MGVCREALVQANENLGDQAGPARLMAGSTAATVIAMEVFVEGDQIAPVRVSIE